MGRERVGDGVVVVFFFGLLFVYHFRLPGIATEFAPYAEVCAVSTVSVKWRVGNGCIRQDELGLV